MARILKPLFGSRHHRKQPKWTLGDEPKTSRQRVDWQLLSLVAFVFVASFVWLFPALDQRTGSHDAADAPRRIAWSGSIHVIDGDTVRSGGTTYRLVGFNTPEAGRHARCVQERTLAVKAAQRLQELVDQSDMELTRVACACPPGTEGTDACNYGRLCATLRANGRDVGSTLIAEGLAERYTCSATSCPPRKDWCAG